MKLTCEYCVKLKACSAKVVANGGEKNPEYEGERFCPDFKKVLTNADHIRAMSDEELAHLLTFNIPDCINYCEDARCGCKWSCKHGEGLLVIKDWLKQPYKEKEE